MLGRTHLAAIAALILVLVAGIAVLGYAALRRGSFAQQIPLLGTLPQPPEPGSGSADAANASREAAGQSAAATPAAQDVAATAGVAAEPPPNPSTSPAPAGARPASVAATPTVSEPSPSGRGAGPVPAPPAAPRPVEAAAAASFDGVRLIVIDASNNSRERQGILELANGRVTLVERDTRNPITTLAYREITNAFYSRSRRPKWRDASGKEIEGRVDLGSFGFFRGDRNWLILLTSGEPVILRLEDSNMQRALEAFEQRAGITVRR